MRMHTDTDTDTDTDTGTDTDTQAHRHTAWNRWVCGHCRASVGHREHSVVDAYATALYWGVATLTSVGYGDVHAQSLVSCTGHVMRWGMLCT